MSITVLSYHDQALVDQVNAQAAERAAAAKISETTSTEDFSTVLNEATSSQSTTQDTSNSNGCPDNLYSIFEEAASTFGVSVNLLTSIARAESNFRTDAVSCAGAVGIMQLMPATAASLGVTNSYDARENIMGGAKLISQLLSKYNGNTSLALAAYNAGSGNVDKYGGIPPFTETQNYVKKVLSYLNTENRSDLKETLSNFIASRNISGDTLDALVDLLQTMKAEGVSSDASTVASTTTTSSTTATTQSITVTVINGPISTETATTGTSTSTEEAATGTTTDTSTSEKVVDSSISTVASDTSTEEVVTDTTSTETESSDTSVPAEDTTTVPTEDTTTVPAEDTTSVSGEEEVIYTSTPTEDEVTDTSASTEETITI